MAAKKAKLEGKPASSQTPVKKSTPTLPDERIAAQLDTSRGNVTHAAQSLGMTRTALSDRIQRTPYLKQRCDDAREAIADAAENALLSAVISRQGWAVCFALKTLGRTRGYIERQEMEHSGRLEVVAVPAKMALDEWKNQGWEQPQKDNP